MFTVAGQFLMTAKMLYKDFHFSRPVHLQLATNNDLLCTAIRHII
jgi:hypothetical protein